MPHPKTPSGRLSHSKYAMKYRATKKGKEVVRATNLRRFGMTIQDYDDLFKLQNGVCAVCLRPETTIHAATKKPRRLSVDHDHITGQVRGLLCHFCNIALAYLGDDALTITRLLDYRQKYL